MVAVHQNPTSALAAKPAWLDTVRGLFPDLYWDVAERVHANTKLLRQGLEGKSGPAVEVKRGFLDRVIRDYEEWSLKGLDP